MVLLLKNKSKIKLILLLFIVIYLFNKLTKKKKRKMFKIYNIKKTKSSSFKKENCLLKKIKKKNKIK